MIREDAGRTPARPAWRVHITRNAHSRSTRQRPWGFNLVSSPGKIDRPR